MSFDGIEINASEAERALSDFQETLRALGDRHGPKAAANALNVSIAKGRKKASKEARKTYTAPVKKLFDSMFMHRASPSNLHGELDIKGKPGVSLIHFKAQPNTPQSHPTAGVSVQIVRKGRRYVKKSAQGGTNPFIMKKKQGGFGVFVRHDRKKNAFEMLLGPSPVQALMRKDVQEAVALEVEQAFRPRLEQEIDKALAKLHGSGK